MRAYELLEPFNKCILTKRHLLDVNVHSSDVDVATTLKKKENNIMMNTMFLHIFHRKLNFIVKHFYLVAPI